MSQKFQFAIPPGVEPGQRLRVQAPDGRMVDVIVPPNATAGMKLQISLDNIPKQQSQFQTQPSFNNFGTGFSTSFSPPSPTNSFNTSQTPNLMMIIVPPNVSGGKEIVIQTPEGKRLTVKLPFSAKPGDKLKLDASSGKFMDSNNEVSIASPVLPSQRPLSELDFANIPTAEPVSKVDSTTLPPFPSWWTFQAQQVQAIGYGLRPGRVGLPPPPCTGRKKALLIGINYPGTRAALNGCVNDAYAMKEFLMSKGFQNTPETMVLLVDSAPDSRFQPTKANILKGMQWLLSGAQHGDTLFFHYSGHGAQESDTSGHEKDGLNETILPSDFQTQGTIKDDQIWDALVARCPIGCRLYALMDCCHCGTGMDLSFNWKNHSRWEQEPNPSFSEGDVILFSGCDDHQTSADAYNRLAKSAGGAMTTSFIQCATRYPNQSIGEFLYTLHSDIRQRGFDQVPQLSASQTWNPNQRTLDFDQNICPNMNQNIGKIVYQRFKPQKPNMGDSPLGPMLLAAGIGVLVAPELLSMGGDVLGGIFGGFGGGDFDFGF